MCVLWHILYNLVFIPIGLLMSTIGTVVIRKLSHRATILLQQQPTLTQIKKSCNRDTFLFHAASVGELEQIKPLIRLMHAHYPHNRIVVTVFSSSAYHKHSDIPYDTLLLLPYDLPWSMEALIDAISPTFAIFSRYDLWWNLTHALYKRNVPIFIVNATYPSSRFARLPVIRSFYRCLYNRTTLVFTRSEHHRERFQSLGIYPPCIVTPDTRLDQLRNRAYLAQQESFPFLDPQRFRLLLGSSWEQDEALWRNVVQALFAEELMSLQMVIVPHEPTPHHCRKLLTQFPGAVLLSTYSSLSTLSHPSIVIIDRLGILAQLYHHVSAAYVGGGFGRGVHSLLEAAFAGIPLACGPHINRSDDAHELQEAGCLTIITSEFDAIQWVREIMASDKYQERSKCYAETLKDNSGSSQYVLEIIESVMSSKTV